MLSRKPADSIVEAKKTDAEHGVSNIYLVKKVVVSYLEEGDVGL